MYNVNFLNTPGIQNDQETFDDKDIEIKIESVENDKEREVISTPKRKYFSRTILSFIILFLMFLYTVFNKNNLLKESPEKQISISYILKMISPNNDNTNLVSINLFKDKLKIIFSSLAEKNIYEKLNLFREFDINAMALIEQDNKYLHINQQWYSSKNDEWDLIELKQIIKDLKGIGSEIYKNKLIIVSDYDNLISLFESFDKLEVIHSFKFKVDLIDDQNKSDIKYYKFIIEQ